jgi:hypothetical protein
MKVDETFGHRAFHAAMFEYSLTAPSNSSATPLDNNPILLRVCPECKQTHKKVYYRRLTPVDNVDLLHCIVHRRDNCDGQNVWKKDFTLHSTYEDAVAGIDEWSCPNLWCTLRWRVLSLWSSCKGPMDCASLVNSSPTPNGILREQAPRICHQGSRS